MTSDEINTLLMRGYNIYDVASGACVGEETLRDWLKMSEQTATQEVEHHAAKIHKEKTRERLNSELLSCPFCGGKAEIRNEIVRDSPRDCYEVVFVTCLECGASTERKVSDGYYGLKCRYDEIAALWNRRVKED